jgi:hypothetical protein
MVNVKWDWKKTVVKFVKSAVYVVIAGLGVSYGNSNWYLLLAPAFVAVENVIKNWK